jgi:hypothetical protein
MVDNRKAKNADDTVMIELYLHHSGGKDYGSISIWKRKDKNERWEFDKRIDVDSENEGYREFNNQAKKYNADSPRRRVIG